MKFNIWNIFLGFIIGYLILQIHGDINSYKDIKSRNIYIRKNFERETRRQEELKNILAKLENKKFIEEQARIKLNLVKKGETAYKTCF